MTEKNEELEVVEKKEQKLVKYDRPLNMPVQTHPAFKNLLLANEKNLKKLIPPDSNITWALLESTALEAAIRQPKILKCTGLSVLLSVKRACEFGLSLNPASRDASLVPFFDKDIHGMKCQLIIEFGGKNRLIIENSDVTMIETVVVYKGDEFLIEQGTNPTIHHLVNPTASREEKDIVGFYSVAHYEHSSVKHIEYMTKAEVDKVRAVSKMSSGIIWSKNYAEMGKKTVEHRHSKRLPLSGPKANLLHKLLQHDYDTTGLRESGIPPTSPEDRMKLLQGKLHPEEEKVSEKDIPSSDKTEPVPPKFDLPTDHHNLPPDDNPERYKNGPPEKNLKKAIKTFEEDQIKKTVSGVVDSGFEIAGITDPKEIDKLKKEFRGRETELFNHLSKIAEEKEGATPPEEEELA